MEAALFLLTVLISAIPSCIVSGFVFGWSWTVLLNTALSIGIFMVTFFLYVEFLQNIRLEDIKKFLIGKLGVDVHIPRTPHCLSESRVISYMENTDYRMWDVRSDKNGGFFVRFLFRKDAVMFKLKWDYDDA
jgi:hypothetical protein